MISGRKHTKAQQKQRWQHIHYVQTLIYTNYSWEAIELQLRSDMSYLTLIRQTRKGSEMNECLTNDETMSANDHGLDGLKISIPVAFLHHFNVLLVHDMSLVRIAWNILQCFPFLSEDLEAALRIWVDEHQKSRQSASPRNPITKSSKSSRFPH